MDSVPRLWSFIPRGMSSTRCQHLQDLSNDFVVRDWSSWQNCKWCGPKWWFPNQRRCWRRHKWRRQWIRRRNRMLRERTTTTTAKCGHSVAKNKFVAKTRGSTTIVCPFCFQFSPVKYLLRSPLILLQPFNSLVNTKRTTFIGLRQWQLARPAMIYLQNVLMNRY